MSRVSWRVAARDALLIILGSLVFAVGVDSFEIPNGLAAGGVTGLATVFYAMADAAGFYLPVGLQTIVMNVALLSLVIRSGDRGYIVRTVAGIVAWIDDKLKDGPERVFPAISNRWKDDELPSTPETIEAANLDRIVALGFFEGDRLLVEPNIHSGVLMTFNDETGEQVFLTVRITEILGRLRMGEDYRNIPPVESADGSDWWAELRRRYPKETFWVPRKYRR